MIITARLARLAPIIACAALAVALGPTAAAQALEDDGGASWRIEQPPPPPPPPGVVGSSTPVGLGKIGDIKFWAPNRGLLITAGNGSTIPPGLWAYNGVEWHELSIVCGATDGRIAWAGPDEFWTISDGRPGQAPNAHGEPPPLADNTLCHFSGGKVVASYGSLAFQANSYQPMHAAGCLGPSDCWFAGDPLPVGQTGSFHLRWKRGSLAPEPFTPEGHAVQDMTAYEGQLLESVRLARGDLAGEPSAEPSPLHAINPAGVVPAFEPLTGLPLYGGGQFPEALDFLHLSATGGALWGAAGGQREPPAGSAEGQVTVVRDSGGEWKQLLGGQTEPSGAAQFPGEIPNSIAAEPGSEKAWMALETQTDAERPSPTESATVARIAADGSLSKEDEQQLPTAGEGAGPKGAAAKIACPAPHDCWMATTQGWLFHLTTGSEGLARDSDPAFAGLITERPEDEGVPKLPPDSPPVDDSGLPGELPPLSGVLPESPPPEKVAAALLSRIHTRIVHGSTLELRFHLAVRARVRLLARRRRALVASTPTRTLAAGNRKLLLRLDVRRWPTRLEMKTHALAPLPLVAPSAGGGNQSVTTNLLKLPHRAGLLP
jgi:hypothetical protein